MFLRWLAFAGGVAVAVAGIWLSFEGQDVIYAVVFLWLLSLWLLRSSISERTKAEPPPPPPQYPPGYDADVEEWRKTGREMREGCLDWRYWLRLAGTVAIVYVVSRLPFDPAAWWDAARARIPGLAALFPPREEKFGILRLILDGIWIYAVLWTGVQLARRELTSPTSSSTA